MATGLQLTLHISLLDELMIGHFVPVPVLGKREIKAVHSTVDEHSIISEFHFDDARMRRVQLRFRPRWSGSRVRISGLIIDEIHSRIIWHGRVSSQLLLKPIASRMEKKLNEDLRDQWIKRIEPLLEQYINNMPLGDLSDERIDLSLHPPEHISLNWPLASSKGRHGNRSDKL